jgi:glutamate-1-semialdehyde 2,1-aminomutase
MNYKLFSQAKNYIPGGVNSPVRSFRAVGGVPVFIKKAKGSKIYDTLGKEYIDYCMSWGALILGHAYNEVVDTVKKAVENGTSYGTPTELEIQLAKEICEAFPSIEMVRLVNSGTEACMSAIRLARGYTGKNKIIKFDGCYHGHADYLLVKAGSGAKTFGVQSSLGVPKDFTKHTIVLPYNNIDAVEKVVKKYHKDIACIIVEPVAANMGVVLPKENFLKLLREICDYYKIVLIFDEVITGFRLAYGGAQELFGIKADLTCLGKILGGGFPIGAFGGKKEIMEYLSPIGKVYQAGTLSGNPVAVTAGLTTLRILKRNKEKIYKSLESKTKFLCESISAIFKKSKLEVEISQIASMFTIFFETPKHYAKFFHGLLKQGIYFPPSQYEACFLSLSHSEEDIAKTVRIIRKIL